jgi:hypothetical protein
MSVLGKEWASQTSLSLSLSLSLKFNTNKVDNIANFAKESNST